MGGGSIRAAVGDVVRVVWEGLDYVRAERLTPVLLDTGRQLRKRAVRHAPRESIGKYRLGLCYEPHHGDASLGDLCGKNKRDRCYHRSLERMSARQACGG